MKIPEVESVRDIPAMFIVVGILSTVVEMPFVEVGSNSATCLLMGGVAVAFGGGAAEFILTRFSPTEAKS
jgi:hypothetical protein